ncbi:MAG: thiamine phosphate synthase [Zoogloeaceae bacterium]|jgi:thiamine-phosphate pyrophosphorylase|nr:thiamine phosphate synthase [Zoogloeaceae bacterium]
MSPPELAGLYALTPDTPDTRWLEKVVCALLAGGCRLLQYRNKTADDALRRAQAAMLQTLCRQRHAALIINDDPRLAADIGADGVHLGRDDGNLAAARRLLGDSAIIGASCYNDLARAQNAAAAGANYVAFGAMYVSSSKPQAPLAAPALLARARGALCLPVCAIGGITLENAAPLIKAGATMIAVLHDLFQFQSAPARIRARASAYQQLFQETFFHEHQCRTV